MISAILLLKNCPLSVFLSLVSREKYEAKIRKLVLSMQSLMYELRFYDSKMFEWTSCKAINVMFYGYEKSSRSFIRRASSQARAFRQFFAVKGFLS